MVSSSSVITTAWSTTMAVAVLLRSCAGFRCLLRLLSFTLYSQTRLLCNFLCTCNSLLARITLRLGLHLFRERSLELLLDFVNVVVVIQFICQLTGPHCALVVAQGEPH